MRKKIIAGNWKMNKTSDEAEKLVSDILKNLLEKPAANKIIIFFPPFVFLEKISCITSDNSYIFSGAQNCHWDELGAYTGEISAGMLKSCGADYVLIGHSERRQYFKETNELLVRKINIALKNHLIPIYCCGENLIDRQSNHHFDVVKKQIQEGLFHLPASDFKKNILAYEPVWAIGTGETATPQQAQEMHAFIRNIINEKFGSEISSATSILYGGSCNASNASGLFSQPDIDGGLIGGASLNSQEFISIIHSF